MMMMIDDGDDDDGDDDYDDSNVMVIWYLTRCQPCAWYIHANHVRKENMLKKQWCYRCKVHYLAFYGRESNIENMRFLEATMDIKIKKKRKR